MEILIETEIFNMIKWEMYLIYSLLGILILRMVWLYFKYGTYKYLTYCSILVGCSSLVYPTSSFFFKKEIDRQIYEAGENFYRNQYPESNIDIIYVAYDISCIKVLTQEKESFVCPILKKSEESTTNRVTWTLDTAFKKEVSAISPGSSNFFIKESQNNTKFTAQYLFEKKYSDKIKTIELLDKKVRIRTYENENYICPTPEPGNWDQNIEFVREL